MMTKPSGKKLTKNHRMANREEKAAGVVHTEDNPSTTRSKEHFPSRLNTLINL